MQKQILSEIKELKSLLAKIIGTSDLPVEQQFSIEAVDKAAKEYQNLAIERGYWERVTKHLMKNRKSFILVSLNAVFQKALGLQWSDAFLFLSTSPKIGGLCSIRLMF